MRALALLPLALIAACSSERASQDTPVEAVTPAPTLIEPRRMVAADFDPVELGGRIAEMDVGDAAVGGAKEPIARVSAYVACPQGIAQCDPASLPAGTRYTYVLTVTPVAREEATPAPGATPPPARIPVPVPPTLSTIGPVPEFEGAVGYSLAEAAAALGAENAISITLDQGRIVWRAKEGSRWLAGKPITVWWQSARAPDGLSRAYSLLSGVDGAEFSAPFPADKPVERDPAR